MSNDALRLADSIHEMNTAAYMTAIANLNEKNRQQASAYARAKMAKEGKKRTVRPYGGKPAKRTSSTKVDYSKYIRK